MLHSGLRFGVFGFLFLVVFRITGKLAVQADDLIYWIFHKVGLSLCFVVTIRTAQKYTHTVLLNKIRNVLTGIDEYSNWYEKMQGSTIQSKYRYFR